MFDLNALEIEMVQATPAFAGVLNAVDIESTRLVERLKARIAISNTGAFSAYPLAKPFQTRPLVIGIEHKTMKMGTHTLLVAMPYGVYWQMHDNNYQLNACFDAEINAISRKMITVELLPNEQAVSDILNKQLMAFANQIAVLIDRAPYTVTLAPDGFQDSHAIETLSLSANMFVVRRSNAVEAFCEAFREFSQADILTLFDKEQFHHTASYCLNPQGGNFDKYVEVAIGKHIALTQDECYVIETESESDYQLMPIIGSITTKTDALTDTYAEQINSVMTRLSMHYLQSQSHVESQWLDGLDEGF